MERMSAKAVVALVRAIRPLLAGHHPANQGGALADLTATWLAGYSPGAREDFLALQVETIRKLVPVNEGSRGKGRAF